MTGFELVADLTSLRGELAARLVAQWSAVGGLSDLAATATIAIPPAALEACTSVPASWRIVAAPIASGFWDAVLSEAGRQDRAAMVLMAPVVPGAEALGVLLDLLDLDHRLAGELRAHRADPLGDDALDLAGVSR